MAQQDDTRKTTTSNAPRPQNAPGLKCLTTQTSPKGGGSSRSPNSSSKTKQNHDQDDHGIHHHKKSVFTKVKEKARKLKKSISGRKRREENGMHSPYTTPPGSAGSLDDDKDRPEYFGSPLYEPQVAPNAHKQSDKQRSQESDKGSSKKPEHETPSLDSNDRNVDLKQSGLNVSTREDTKSDVGSVQDKGLSVKEYIMNKFEPGEDERALSQAITQTISPKCEKVKEAMNSLLGNEEASENISKNKNVAVDVTPSSSSTTTNDPNLSNTLESNLSNALNISHTTSVSHQNPNSG